VRVDTKTRIGRLEEGVRLATGGERDTVKTREEEGEGEGCFCLGSVSR